jgi:hypothetical protein
MDEDDKPNTLAAWNETRESRIPKIASMVRTPSVSTRVILARSGSYLF